MKILYVASEAAPFAASGGLGDVMGALPKTVKRLGGKETEVGVILPLYKSVSAEYREKMKKISEFHFYHSWRNAYCSVYLLRRNGVSYYFVDNEYYFKRNSLYGDFDDGERFAYFSHAVIEFILRTDRVPDVLHANDWQSALSIVYAKRKYAASPALRSMKTMFTIHNIEYQGKYGMDILGDIFDLDFSDTGLMEYDGCINLLKAAMVAADKVSTVSPHYASELRESFFAFGLQEIVKMCGEKMCGVINGIDTREFTPRKADITRCFGLSDIHEGKAENKVALQKELGLPVNKDVPMIAMVTRLTEGKGIDLVLHVFEELLAEDLQVVILGTGDKKYEKILSDIACRYPDKARALIKFDRTLSKRIYASSDIFLMPSKSEPCGLAQMIACSYGTVPVVRGVGGLYDTIIPYGEKNANGFVFYNFNAHDMLFRLKDALALYRDRAAWNTLRKSAMKTDFTWKKSAKQYLEIYAELCEE